MSDQMLAEAEHFQLPEGDDAKRDSPPADTADESASAATSSKRKRDSSDHDGTGGQSESARRSSFKRVSPSTTALAGTNNGDQGNSYVSADDTSGLDFAALQQHTAEHSGMNGGSDASQQTAAAALAAGSIYPTMNVPQPTDMSFASTGSDHNQSFNMNEHDGQHFESPSGAGRGDHAPKPAVGTDEWHRVRRDNHKEGEFETSSNLQTSSIQYLGRAQWTSIELLKLRLSFTV
jgi:transcriptional regulator CBF1